MQLPFKIGYFAHSSGGGVILIPAFFLCHTPASPRSRPPTHPKPEK